MDGFRTGELGALVMSKSLLAATDAVQVRLSWLNMTASHKQVGVRVKLTGLTYFRFYEAFRA